MRWVRRLLAALALGAGPLPIAALAACPDVPTAAALAEDQYDRLTMTRAFTATDPTALDIASADEAVRNYLALPNAPGETGARGLLFYVSVGETICQYFWTSDRSDVRVFEIEVKTELIEQTLTMLEEGAMPVERAVHRRADPPRQSRAMVPFGSEKRRAGAVDQLRHLSDAIFAPPLRGELERLDSLTIVPARALGIVPFAALDPDGDGAPLVETTSVNVEAALRDVRNARIFALGAGVAPQLIAGDPDASGDAEWTFPRLPGAAREAELVAQLFNTTALIGSQSTVDAVRTKLPGAEYVHIAAHGYSDGDAGVADSFLALTGARLTAFDIQRTRLERNPLVVLSACRTGLGRALDSGIIGLARGFLLAGASSVIASLWNVDDEATSWIMVRFVERLRANPPSVALRLALRDARAKWPDPRIWAAFSLFGSRTVMLDSVAPDTAVIHASIRIGDGDEYRQGSIPVIHAGDAVEIAARNVGGEPLSLGFYYLDAAGAVSELGSVDIAAGGHFADSIGVTGTLAGERPVYGVERLMIVATPGGEALNVETAEAWLRAGGVANVTGGPEIRPPKGIWALARGNANPNAFLPATAGPARAVAIFEMKLEE